MFLRNKKFEKFQFDSIEESFLNFKYKIVPQYVIWAFYMVEFKKFVAIWLSLVVAVSVFTVVGISLLKSENNGVTSANHFSVRWMGFAPTDYASDYPEYYICINNLKDATLRMQIALQIKNQEASPFYFKVDQYSAPPSGWSVLPMLVGAVQVGETKQFIYANASRSKPTSIPQGRLTESISLVVKAYYDSGYTNLYSQDNFTVTFNFLDLTSNQWTTLYHDNFDDGTTQGWTVSGEGYNYHGASVGVSDTYYRTFQYSLRLDAWAAYSYGTSWRRGCFQKTFNVGSVNEVYLIYSIRSDDWQAHYTYGVKINGVTYFKSDTPNLATNTWYQVAVKLKPAQTNAVQIWTVYVDSGTGSNHRYSYLDDVYVIAK
jgi:hypothetical protein